MGSWRDLVSAGFQAMCDFHQGVLPPPTCRSPAIVVNVTTDNFQKSLDGADLYQVPDPFRRSVGSPFRQ